METAKQFHNHCSNKEIAFNKKLHLPLLLKCLISPNKENPISKKLHILNAHFTMPRMGLHQTKDTIAIY